MQISFNSTGMQAGISIASGKDARDYCVVVVKGTFETSPRGEMTLAQEQQPLIATDEHYGDPATTSIRHECDFALEKQFTDVVVVGKAVAPNGKPVPQLGVSLEVQKRRKDLLVLGERRWLRSLGSMFFSDPVPFVEMPLVFERAFGGQDESRGPGRTSVDRRNLVGVGFNPHRKAAQIEGTPVPNLERPTQLISSPRDQPEPIGLGHVGRAWAQRVAYAGTYDARWRDERAPFLPADFDSRYFQSAPEDQQFPHFRGGEQIRCVHMAAVPVIQYVIPALRVPVRFRFVEREVEQVGVLDTVTLEPHLARAMLVWRARIPLGKKLNALREVSIGEPPPAGRGKIIGYRNGKPLFRGLEAAIRWLRETRGTKR
ncbi:DUF2169 domain-containing protein [Pyxidicoccus fallax]|uniref:DUF2169 domain-containing protein n=1 Tax=Pyxidicoccus fallax TaxID=394095 RepID=A0A848LI52_9BACT|nr:DUF2169 domain-containing protein [Pyxidicoccus fallax]NMO17398.1 DUF2169 domain-containing protein [Pyxidicoccus fallax]NPC77903.1 DUF2169 domain-containing protein [Pyxidicoccus fallax]